MVLMTYRTSPDKTKGFNISLSSSPIRDPFKVISPVKKTPFLKNTWPNVAEQTDMRSNHAGFIDLSLP
jgi:hypothetical protein